LHAAELGERAASSAARAEAFGAPAALRLLHLGGDRALAALELLLLVLHALELGLHVEDGGALLGAQRLGAIAVADGALLLDERLTRELLVVRLEGELGALVPFVDLGIEVVDLLPEHLLGGDALDELFARGADLVLHLLDDEIEALLRILRLVQQRTDV